MDPWIHGSVGSTGPYYVAFHGSLFCHKQIAINDRKSTDFANFEKQIETSNGRLPLQDGSDRHETLPKSVSDDSRRFKF